MVDLHTSALKALGCFGDVVLHSNYVVVFWCIVLLTFFLVSPLAAFAVLLGALYVLLASWGQGPCTLPRFKGKFDVLLGQLHRASTLTPDMIANNNVTIHAFGPKLVIAYRKAPSHFASPLARVIVATASPQDLDAWTVIWEHHTGKDDLRETILFELQGKLFLYYVKLAPERRGFTPRRIQWTSTTDLKVWTDPVDVGAVGELVWDVKVREDVSGKEIAYKTSYVGNHYSADAEMTVLFEQSRDGIRWSPVGKESGVYTGGISEVSFEFTPRGDLVAIGRNEDGDRTGFGSQLFFARKTDLGKWQPLRVSLPHRFDSPRLVSMGGELILFARYAREPYALLPTWLPFGLQRFANLVYYSLRPKGAAAYRMNPPEVSGEGEWPSQPIELIRFLERAHGDTGFFSLAKLPGSSEDWVVANYTSMCHSGAPWIFGQIASTDIYVCRCRPIHLD